MSAPRYASEALNSTWRINVIGQVYGPYTGHQIRSFAREGRLAPHSIVQAGEMGPWITAIDDPVLGQLFVPEPVKKSVQPVAAAGVGAPAAAPESNFVVVTELRGTGTGAIQSVISKLGEAYRLSSSVWLLRSSRTAAAIRNELTPCMGRSDTLFVVDTNQSKTAWFNLGPEADAHIRKVWKREAEKTH